MRTTEGHVLGARARAVARPARLGRGALAAAFSTFVALASHVLAGGAMPGLLGVLVPLVFATSASIALAGLRRSWLRLSVSVALSQLLFHTLFVVGAASSATVAVVGGAGPHAGHGVDPVVLTVGSAAGSATHAGHAGHGGLWMMLAHAAAAALTVVTLRRGEIVLARLTGLADRLVSFLLLPVVRLSVLPAHPRAALSGDEGVWVPAPLSVVRSCVVRRGPPALALA